MEGPKQKRTRGENWLDEDRNLLLELIKKRVDAIENKNTDNNTNLKKKEAWIAVNKSFNLMCRGSPRTIPQLKVQWGQTKFSKKKAIKEVFYTGGGGPPQVPPDDSQDITAWLPQESNKFDNTIDNTIDTNEFDSDSLIGGISKEEPLTPTQEEFEKSDEEFETNKKQDFVNIELQKIAETEINLKYRLFLAKMANQEKKSRNLDVKYEVLKAKLAYYKNKKDEE